ncbi:TauD/TfdA dioxygenase family protein [Bradyrhizobium japonicum]|uniref:TauD/TfdA dioxygenase family protein n=1 Tax=Bradyrhizobium japonicum TaxID=375 RepID=UPI002B2516AB|nr:TauD/TfdA family dioxygenase [Bradyrhizobium japonicum]WRK47546.1 TauD/TfdA family dioxygenase [Bradyrhizobium japonicum]
MVTSTLQKRTPRASNITAASPNSIAVHPLTGHIGAEIEGVNLEEPLHPLVLEELKAALLKWKVIFFRDQALSHEEHIAFAKAFGEPTVGHPVFGFVERYPQIYSVARDRLKGRAEGEQVIPLGLAFTRT